MTRIWAICLIFGILCCLFTPIFAYAESGSDTIENAAVQADGSKDREALADKSTDNSESLSDNASDTDSGEDKTFFGSLYNAVEENVSEILSLLAFLGSVIIMLCYKRGFLPLLSDGIKALISGVKSIGEKTESLNLTSEEFNEKIKERIDTLEAVLEKIDGILKSIEEKLDEAESAKSEREQLKTVLSCEIDMLYEIFMAASLPQYLKDNVGEKIAEMKRLTVGADSHDREN